MSLQNLKDKNGHSLAIGNTVSFNVDGVTFQGQIMTIAQGVGQIVLSIQAEEGIHTVAATEVEFVSE